MIGRRRSIENASCAIRTKPSGVTTMHSDGEELSNDVRHTEKIRKRQVAQSKIMANKTREQGLLISHTGKGKGKTSAATGMVGRAIGHGMKVSGVQDRPSVVKGQSVAVRVNLGGRRDKK